MAHIFELDAVSKEIRKNFARLFQSGNLNFLIGSGASDPAIPSVGQMEQEIARLYEIDDDQGAGSRMYGFLASIQDPMNKLILGEQDGNNTITLTYYKDFLGIIETILSERRTNLLPKQATIFTTNYDLFVEKASISYSTFKLNDGFSRVPSLDNRMEYSSRTFFNTTYNTGNLYNYKVEIPSINLIKLHGSFSWTKDNDGIVYRVANKALLTANQTPEQINAFIASYAVVLPQITKFRTTIMDRTYYELLRIYANELDRENTLIIAFGFSFGDEHILDITKRALKNPTLRLVVFAFDEAAIDSYVTKLNGYNNVDIIVPSAGAQITFKKFNETIRGFLPKAGQTE